jgi:DNA repair ATPase RecN
MRTHSRLAPLILAPFVFAAGLLGGPAFAACGYPPAEKVPDGKSSTQAEMNAAQQRIQDYMGKMQEYLDCLEQEEAALPEEQRNAETRAVTVKRYNAAVEAMEALAAQFNEQVRAYKAAGGR